MLKKGAITKRSSIKGQFLSTYFLAEKSNGEKRFILNLKKLYKFLNPLHFKLEDRKTVAKIIFRNARKKVQEACGISKDIRDDMNKIHQKVNYIEYNIEKYNVEAEQIILLFSE